MTKRRARKKGRTEKSNKPKQEFDPKSPNRPIQTQDPGNYDRLTVAWRISQFDYGGPWGDTALKGESIEDLARGWAHTFEQQTWGALKTVGGGKKAGTNHHSIEIARLSKGARDRLVAIRRDDLDEVFSFRINATTRLYGVRDGRAFNVLWFDPWHGDIKKAVCPSKKRHT